VGGVRAVFPTRASKGPSEAFHGASLAGLGRPFDI
jgi:hypothetical protein